jgi:ribosomal protein S18 acetylase RimI-like enzyme
MKINKRFLLNKFYELNFGIYFNDVEDLVWAKVYTSDFINEEYNNHAVVFSLDKEIDERLVTIEKILLNKPRRPAIYIPGFSKVNNLDKALSKYNYASSFRDAWMIFKGSGSSLNQEGYKTVRQIKNDSRLIDEFEKISTLAYGGTKTFDNPYGGINMQGFINAAKKGFMNYPERMEGYLLNFKDTFVSCAVLLFDNEMGYIANVATIPGFRNQGFGTFITNYATARSKTMGHKYTLLATELGSSVEQYYKNIGYETVLTGECFVKSIV